MFHILTNKKGFTLTELLLAMGLSAVVMASVGAIYYQQQKSFLAQEQIASAQQNVRAAMYFMEREIRSAGYDPTQKVKPSIQVANNDSITFQADLNGNGTIDGGETITYLLYDSGGDGDTDLGRNAGGGNQPVAENIDALNFVYLDGGSPPTILNVPDTITGDVPAGDISNIRSVEITIVASTGRADPGYTDTQPYFNQRDSVNPILAAQNDNLRRRSLSTIIACRNLWQ